MDKIFTRHQIDDRSYVSFVKREIHVEVSKLTFTDRQAGEIDIIVAEVCSNLIKYAGSGSVLYRTTVNDDDSTFEILCIDNGSGMADPTKMMKDGYSSSNTLGHGLGTMERLSSVFQLYSIPDWGTVVYSMVTTAKHSYEKKKAFDIETRSLVVPKPREVVCGDGSIVVTTDNDVRIFLGDGLGHGEHAKEAIDKARTFFLECGDCDPVSVLRGMHEHVRKTRGLVGTVAVFDKSQNAWRLCGIGNIATRIQTGIEYKNYMSYNGTIGLNIPNSLKETVIPAEKNQHLILTSDGIRSRWELAKYPSMYKYDPLVLAASIYKDFCRHTDDASILIAKVS
jgi:anti-sigma regulatory factor (Ser/Thr protein kinase)